MRICYGLRLTVQPAVFVPRLRRLSLLGTADCSVSYRNGKVLRVLGSELTMRAAESSLSFNLLSRASGASQTGHFLASWVLWQPSESSLFLNSLCGLPEQAILGSQQQ